MIQNTQKQNTAKTITGAKPTAPATPAKVDTKSLPVTDPRRKLTKVERKALTPEQKKDRKSAIMARRGPPKVRLHKLVMRMQKRAAKIEKAVGADGATAKLLLALAGTIDALPSDWKPVRGAGGGAESKFSEGMLVNVKLERREQFVALGIPATELVEMIVVNAKGRDVLVRSEGGMKMMVPSKALEAAPR